jgi:hypothetical protein
MTGRSRSSLTTFLRLWAVMLFTYFTVKFVFNLGILGYIDLTRAAFLEIAFVPLGQSYLFWLITRRQRRSSIVEVGGYGSASDA